MYNFSLVDRETYLHVKRCCDDEGFSLVGRTARTAWSVGRAAAVGTRTAATRGAASVAATPAGQVGGPRTPLNPERLQPPGAFLQGPRDSARGPSTRSSRYPRVQMRRSVLAPNWFADTAIDYELRMDAAVGRSGLGFTIGLRKS
jgi:hypothetical protein